MRLPSATGGSIFWSLYRKLVVEELNHRLKNKVASVYAIIGYELKNDQEIWDKVQGRLRALAFTDEFIAKSDRQSVSVTDILNAELRPYDSRRVALTGDPVHLPPKLAVSLALIFHELATNAAKYGALSAPTGRIEISWHRAGNHMKMMWAEHDGPPATPPASAGFGRRLLERGLDPFHGSIEQKFSFEGFSAHIAFAIPDDDQHSFLPIFGRRPKPAP